MRIKLTLKGSQDVFLPKGFIYYLQSFIYRAIVNPKIDWLHNNGFIHKDGRRFKLFVFSSILQKGKFVKSKSLFYFPKLISFYISSPVKWILEDFVKGTILEDEIYLYKNRLSISSIEVLKPLNLKKYVDGENYSASNDVKKNSDVKKNNIKNDYINNLLIKTITPIEVHTTEDVFENEMLSETAKKVIKKKTVYIEPFDKEFSKRVNANLKRKWESFFKKNCDYNIEIKPVFTKKDYLENPKRYKKVQYYGKNGNWTIINGWYGDFILKGDKKLIEFAYETGLGSRNSQGFGMWNVIERDRGNF